jgi:carbon monoxide dehydrogenase subunit G
MASIRKEISIDARPEAVWAAWRDWGAVERLAPGFVTETRLDGEDRIVTFANGVEVREILVDCDDEARRLVWSIVGGPYSHHNGVAQVFAEGENGSRLVWSADLLPNEMAEVTDQTMGRGMEVIKQTLESGTSSD